MKEDKSPKHLEAVKFVWQPLLYIMVLSLTSWVSRSDIKVNSRGIADSAINLKTPNLVLMQNLIVVRINNLREKNKLTKLIWDDTLYMSSKNHLNSMLSDHFFDHKNPSDINSPDLKQRVELYSKNYGYLSENLLETFPFEFSGKSISYVTKKRNTVFSYLNPQTLKPLKVLNYNQFAQEIVNRWINSPIHYKNMMFFSFSRLDDIYVSFHQF